MRGSIRVGATGRWGWGQYWGVNSGGGECLQPLRTDIHTISLSMSPKNFELKQSCKASCGRYLFILFLRAKVKSVRRKIVQAKIA